MNNWTSFLETLAWIALIIYVARKFSTHLGSLFEAIRLRIKSGSSFKAGPVQLGEDLQALEKVPATPNNVSDDGEPDWSTERNGIYKNNRGLFLAHVIEPSDEEGQLFDIFIYLVRHKSTEFSDIKHVEFFLGAYWGNKVFKETSKNGLFGISTSAYGPLLCTCRVSMEDGSEIQLHRYIDFEMGRVFKRDG